MHRRTMRRLRHDHVFGQDARRPGERRTLAVIALTALTMVVEVVCGIAFGSMALLADGLHMASHTAALSISLAGYVYARRRAGDARFSFGTGKVNALAGFTGAILLAVFALMMVVESATRLLEPVPIVFDYAIAVAVLGLVVNAASMLILGGGDGGGSAAQDRNSGNAGDHNLRSAYLHVLADALTSVAAIAALLAGKYLGAVWLDPTIGMLGAVLVTHWSIGLARQSSAVLLDRQAPAEDRRAVIAALEAHRDVRVADLHLWSVGPGIYAAEIALVTRHPEPPEVYKRLVPDDVGVVHTSVEVHRSDDAPPGDMAAVT